MEYKKFYGVLDADEYATGVAEEWRSGTGEPRNADTLKGVFEISDEENSLDEEGEDVYFVVDETGAVGLTENHGAEIEWLAIPAHQRSSAGREYSAPAGRFVKAAEQG